MILILDIVGIVRLEKNGKDFQYDDPCFTEQCISNGVCRIDEFNNYYCLCGEGYFGRNCDLIDPCSSNLCEHEGICRRTDENTYYCSCT